MTRMRTHLLLYSAHLRARPLRELLALLGIAAGVALLFAVQVANKSVTGSFEELAQGLTGRASIEVAARGPQGFSQNLYPNVEGLPQVRAAAPVVESQIAVVGPTGRRPLTLIGFDERLERLGSELVGQLARTRDISSLGFYLPAPTAKAIGVRPGDRVTVEVGGRVKRIPLAGTADAGEIGALAQSPVAMAPLGHVQAIAAMPGRLTRILVVPRVGAEAQARSALKALSKGTLNVRSSESEARLLSKAATADRQSTALFGAVGLIVGILLAYNAMLLSIMERRRDIAGLHSLGASKKTLVASLALESVFLGLVGSFFGIVLGDILSRYVLHQVPGYLAPVFAIGSQRVVEPETVLIAALSGVVAALAAAAHPTLKLLRTPPLVAFGAHGPDAVEGRGSSGQMGLLWSGVALISAYVVLSLALPKTTLLVTGALIVGLVMILPPLITYLLSVAQRMARFTESASLRVAIGELIATPARAAALAAVGSLAVFAVLSMTGTARDLQRGIERGTEDFFGNADIWISPSLEENTYLSRPFAQRQVSHRLSRIRAVEAMRVYRGSFVDLGDRRLRVIAESPAARQPIASSQLVRGKLETAIRRIRRGGWATLTDTVATERKLKIGDTFEVPAPSGNSAFKLAATTTNYGWGSGTLLLSSRDYAHAWKTRQASALEVDLADGVQLTEGRRIIENALGVGSALRVQTAEEGRQAYAVTVNQGLGRLEQIADMVLVAAILAVVAATLSSVWQRRQRLWSLASLGMRTRQVHQTIFTETGVVLILGCLVGVAFGLVGQALGSRWLHLTTAYPVPFVPAWGVALRTVALVTVLAVLAAALPVRYVFTMRRVVALSPE